MYNPVKEENLKIKIYYSGGECVVMATLGVVDRNCKIRVVLLFRINCKNG